MDVYFCTLLFSLFLSSVNGESCLFGFESDEELGDFNQACDGNIGKWIIIDSPANGNDKPSDAGERILTVEPGSRSCMQTYKKITMAANQEISALIYVKNQHWANYFELSINIVCDGEAEKEWLTDLYSQGLYPNGTWKTLSYYYPLTQKAMCAVKIQLFRSSIEAEIYLDKIVLSNTAGSEDECYAVSRPPHLTTTDEVPTTTHSAPTTTTPSQALTTTSPSEELTTTTSEELTTTTPSDPPTTTTPSETLTTTNPPEETATTTPNKDPTITTPSDVPTTTVEERTTTKKCGWIRKIKYKN